MRLEDLPKGARIGTSSPRRTAQLKRLGDFELVPIRGHVPTRVAKIERDGLDGVVLAAAGVKRLGIEHPHVIELPTDKVVPAPAQGALAIQTRVNDAAEELIAVLNHEPTHRAVDAERFVLSAINAGCHTPVGGLAKTDGARIDLHAVLFSDDFERCVESVESGNDPREVGEALGKRLLAELGTGT